MEQVNLDEDVLKNKENIDQLYQLYKNINNKIGNMNNNLKNYMGNNMGNNEGQGEGQA